MKSYSTKKPDPIVRSGQQYYFQCNAELRTFDDDGVEVTEWICDKVALAGKPSRTSLIAAGMQARYTRDDELAIINNKLEHRPGADDAYTEYSNYRDAIKQQVADAGYPKSA